MNRIKDMTSEDRNFGDLKIGAVFLYHGQTYRKETEDSAVMLRWAHEDEQIIERIAHRFFEEIIIQLPESEDNERP